MSRRDRQVPVAKTGDFKHVPSQLRDVTSTVELLLPSHRALHSNRHCFSRVVIEHDDLEDIPGSGGCTQMEGGVHHGLYEVCRARPLQYFLVLLLRCLIDN